jgi:hypothetical protein
VKKLGRVSDAEVMGEYLKSEFNEQDFDSDRQECERLVVNPDFSNKTENEMRRALLFRRRQHVWRELPLDTQWWEVELEADDLHRLRLFARGKMARVAGGNLYLEDFAKHIRTRGFPRFLKEDVQKIRTLSQHLQDCPQPGFILLIAPDEYHALAILDGNHRIAAAVLVSSDLIFRHFRFYYGCSPRMTECLWYRNTRANFARYLARRFTNLFRRESTLEYLAS